MPFKPGKEKTGGRAKGTPNKANERLRQMLSDFLESNFEAVQDEFEQLTGRDKIKAYTELLPYVLPRLQNVSNQLDFDKMSEEDIDRVLNHLLAKQSQ